MKSLFSACDASIPTTSNDDVYLVDVVIQTSQARCRGLCTLIVVFYHHLHGDRHQHPRLPSFFSRHAHLAFARARPLLRTIHAGG